MKSNRSCKPKTVSGRDPSDGQRARQGLSAADISGCVGTRFGWDWEKSAGPAGRRNTGRLHPRLQKEAATRRGADQTRCRARAGRGDPSRASAREHHPQAGGPRRARLLVVRRSRTSRVYPLLVTSPPSRLGSPMSPLSRLRTIKHTVWTVPISPGGCGYASSVEEELVAPRASFSLADA